MGRLIGSVVVGYLVMAVLVFALLSGAYVAVGTDRAFLTGSYDVSMLWSALSIVLGLVAAWVGGMTCTAIARDPRGWKWLAVLVLALGLALAVPTLQQPPNPAPRLGDVRLMEAVTKGRQPPWAALLNPVIGALGVMVGGRRRNGAAA